MYVVLIPLLLIIYIAATVYRYRESREEYARLQRQNIYSLQSSLDIIEEDVRNLSLNLAINDDIRSILTADDPEAVSRDVRLWQNIAPCVWWRILLHSRVISRRCLFIRKTG